MGSIIFEIVSSELLTGLKWNINHKLFGFPPTFSL